MKRFNAHLIVAFMCGIAACGGGDDMNEEPGVDTEIPEPSLPDSDNGTGTGDAGTPVGEEPDTGDSDMPPLAEGVATLAGSDQPGDEDGRRGVARFHNPVNVVVGDDGNIYVADFDNGRIRRITPAGDTTTLTIEMPGFQRPFGMTKAADGTIYIQTDYNAGGQHNMGGLWRLPPGGDQILLELDGIGKARGMAALPDGRLVLADSLAHVLSLYNPRTGSMSILAGSRGEAGYVDGVGTEARFDAPYDVAVLGNDEILVADRNNHRLRRVTVSTGEVSSFAGTGDPGSRDGALESASFDQPQALATDAKGTVYVASLGSHVIRRIAGNEVTTIAGSGAAGYLDGDQPLAAEFFGLEGMDVDADGRYLYIADGTRGEPLPYHRVRRVSLTEP